MPPEPSLLEALRAALEPSGLNLFGVADVATYDAQVKPARQSQTLHPGTRSIVVIGSGGPALWYALVADLERNPRHLTHEQHPLDAFVQREVQRADAVLGNVSRRWFFTAANAPIHLDFRLLGHLAGLGSDSRLRLLMNERHGPWVGLRAACFLEADLPANAPGGPDLCDGCPAPCISACPGNVFPQGRWDVDRCSAFHYESDVCRTRCYARLACPKGAESRYPLEAILYHSNPNNGRPLLRKRLGIPDAEDQYEGIAPRWGDWRSKVDAKG